VEKVLCGLFAEFTDWTITEPPFPRIPYREVMLRYGTDKPDLRIPIEIADVSDVFAASSFNAFRAVVEKGGVVRAVPVKGIAGKPRSFFDRLVAYAQELGSQGLAYLTWTAAAQNGNAGAAAGDAPRSAAVKGPLVKYLAEEQLAELARRCGMASGDVLFFLCNQPAEAERLAGALRLELGEELELVESNSYRFCWVVDYPMYQWNEEQQAVEFSHNPFSMPQGGMEALKAKDPLEILAWQYDIVCNGVELSSGAIRNHSPDIMIKAFEIGGYKREEVEHDFGGMLSAFRLGAPPHGGIAPGLDRIVMLLADEPNLREVVAFPMNQKAQDLMMNAPRPVSEKQLTELGLRVLPRGRRR